MLMNSCAIQAAMDPMPALSRELQYWRRRYPRGPCFKSGLVFERYVATFKFGYDTFLLNHRKSSAELLPTLCHQYKDRVAACDRIDWAEAEMIVSATWARLQDRPVLTVS